MTSTACSDRPETWVAVCTLLELLVPLSIAGVALTNAGFARTRATLHVLFASLCAVAVSGLAYVSLGFVWQGAACLPFHSIQAAGRTWNVLGSGPFFLHGVDAGSSGITLYLVFGLFAAGLCSLIPLGAASERWRLGPALLSCGLFSAFLFPVYGHWSWAGGWLAQLGVLDGMRGIVDIGGSGFIHAVGGLWALSVVWIVGPRRGKYGSSGMPAATPGHNAPYILAGCLLAFVGWCGINGSGSMLLGGQTSGGDVFHLPYVVLNTFAGAMGGLISSAFITRVRFGKPDPSLCANGWIGGLVSSGAGCTLLRPPEAMLVGLISGTLIVFAIEILELRLKVDDPGGAISVHAVGGLWGLLAAGVFQSGAQLMAQLCGISVILGVMFPTIYAVNLLVNRFMPYRVNREGERQGMDLCELGSGAYPEFMIHRDDFNLR